MFCKQFRCHLHNIFSSESYVRLHQPLDANSWPKVCNNKNIQCLGTFKFLKKYQNKWETSVFWQQLFCHPRKCLFQGMDSSTTSLLACPIPLKNMKWQLEISQSTLAWISSQWLQVHWVGEGNGCIISTCITFLQHDMFCNQTKKFIYHLIWSWNEIQHLSSHVKQINSYPI